eukprot:1130787-Prorocentrum_lima.AAC.1
MIADCSTIGGSHHVQNVVSIYSPVHVVKACETYRVVGSESRVIFKKGYNLPPLSEILGGVEFQNIAL